MIPPRLAGASGSESLCKCNKNYQWKMLPNLLKNKTNRNWPCEQLTAWFNVPLDTLRVPIPCDDILLDSVLFRLAAIRFEFVFWRLLAIGLYECELWNLKPTNRIKAIQKRRIKLLEWMKLVWFCDRDIIRWRCQRRRIIWRDRHDYVIQCGFKSLRDY